MRACQRAIKNCYWDAELRTRYARALEQYNEEHSKIIGKFGTPAAIEAFDVIAKFAVSVNS